VILRLSVTQICGDMFTTERQTQHAESLPYRIGPSWAYRSRVVFVARGPISNQDGVVSWANVIELLPTSYLKQSPVWELPSRAAI